MSPTDVRDTMYLYETDLVLDTFDDRFSAGILTEIITGDAAQVIAWRTALRATPQMSKTDCLTLLQSVQTLLHNYVHSFTTKDYASLYTNYRSAQVFCQS